MNPAKNSFILGAYKKKKTKKGVQMKLSKKAIVNKINTCLLNEKYEQVEIIERALGFFNLAPWYGESGIVEKIIEIKKP